MNHNKLKLIQWVNLICLKRLQIAQITKQSKKKSDHTVKSLQCDEFFFLTELCSFKTDNFRHWHTFANNSCDIGSVLIPK